MIGEQRLAHQAQRLQHGLQWSLQKMQQRWQGLAQRVAPAMERSVASHQQRLERANLRLELLDPRLVLQRGYALLTDSHGLPVTQVRQAPPGSALQAQLSDGSVDVVVTQPRLL